MGRKDHRFPCSAGAACRATIYWVCAYANRQHALSEAVSANPEELIVCSMDVYCGRSKMYIGSVHTLTASMLCPKLSLRTRKSNMVAYYSFSMIVCSMDLRLRLHASGVPSKRRKRWGCHAAVVGSADWPIRLL